MESLLEKFQTAFDADDWYDDEWDEGGKGEFFTLAEEAQKTYPENPIWLLWLSRFSHNPIEYLEEYITQTSGDAADEARKELADWYMETDDCESAKRHLEIIIQGKYKDHPETILSLAEIYFDEEDFNMAEYYSSIVLNLTDPKSSLQAHFILGKVYADREEWFSAIDSFRQVAETGDIWNQFQASARLAAILDMFTSSEAMQFYQHAYRIGLERPYVDVNTFNMVFEKAEPEKWSIIGPLVEDYSRTFSLEHMNEAFVNWDIKVAKNLSSGYCCVSQWNLEKS